VDVDEVKDFDEVGYWLGRVGKNFFFGGLTDIAVLCGLRWELFLLRGRSSGSFFMMFTDGAKSSLNSIWVWVFKKVLWVVGESF
jgi:hypothetical protein